MYMYLEYCKVQKGRSSDWKASHSDDILLNKDE